MITDKHHGIIDAHVHFWELAGRRYHWLRPDSPLYRDFTPSAIRSEMDSCGVVSGVMIEASNTVAESRALLALAELERAESGRAWGVVGWGTFEPGESVLESLVPGVRGLRLNWLQPRPDLTALHTALTTLRGMSIVIDVLAGPDQVREVAACAARYPTISFIVNHWGGLALRPDGVMEWAAHVGPLVALPNVLIKLSGGEPSSVALLRVYLHQALRLFGPHRLMFGSNYPVSTLGLPYAETIERFLAACADLDSATCAAILAGTAANTYRLPVQRTQGLSR